MGALQSKHHSSMKITCNVLLRNVYVLPSSEGLTLEMTRLLSAYTLDLLLTSLSLSFTHVILGSGSPNARHLNVAAVPSWTMRSVGDVLNFGLSTIEHQFKLDILQSHMVTKL